jgi:hypothetical protein
MRQQGRGVRCSARKWSLDLLVVSHYSQSRNAGFIHLIVNMAPSAQCCDLVPSMNSRRPIGGAILLVLGLIIFSVFVPHISRSFTNFRKLRRTFPVSCLPKMKVEAHKWQDLIEIGSNHRIVHKGVDYGTL